MNSKFLLALLTLNGLLFGTNSTFASTLPAVKHHQSPANLSQIISQSIGLTQDTNSLVEFAINRALISQTLNNCQVPNSSTTKDSTRIYQPMVRGRIVKPTPQPRSQPIGKMVNPIPQPVVGQVQLLPDPKPTQPTTTPASPSTNPTPTPTTTPAAIKTPATPTAPTPVSEFRRRVIYGGARG